MDQDQQQTTRKVTTTREDLAKFSKTQVFDLAAFKNTQASHLKDTIQRMLVEQAIELGAFEAKQRADLVAAEADVARADAELAALFDGFTVAMEARSAYERDHPEPKPLRDEVLTAMRRPEVEGARRAFIDYVREVTRDKLIPTNYYDQVLCVAIMSVQEGEPELSQSAVAKVARLVELYLEFVEALAPYQPDAEDVRVSNSAPNLPWECDVGETSDKVFYFLEGSGGYWISRGDAFRGVIAAAAAAAPSATDDDPRATTTEPIASH
jgi:hypothetical protein